MVADALRDLGHEVTLVEVVTEGDVTTAALTELGGTGVFAGALRKALLDGQIDLAVHSLKDLPVAAADGLTIAAIPARADARDALIARDGLTLGQLPVGARIGTGSPRRVAQLAALGLGVETVGIRGNVDTRIGKVTSGELDAVVLARAGLQRLGRTDEITESIDPLQMLPAPGQGALAIEVRSDDEGVLAAVAVLDDPDTRAAVSAERALLATLEAGCAAPVGALAEVVEEVDGSLLLSLRAFVGSEDGTFELRRSATGPIGDPVAVGQELAATLLEDGAADAMSAPGSRPPAGPSDPKSGGAPNPQLVPSDSVEQRS
ncbi:hydroxymethylbilane synthase [Branchiibius cervicis]|uniref:Hydroxymethylbilane synthase n=1 Tax=Branchiibius cervicis TaxID=908252 RepID=A0ABW2APB5_9MICO